MPKFETSYGRKIPAGKMRKVRKRLLDGEDWQKVGTEELRHLIPHHDEDLEELNEILSEAENNEEHDESELTDHIAECREERNSGLEYDRLLRQENGLE